VFVLFDHGTPVADFAHRRLLKKRLPVVRAC
jgi:hypothetical protein